MTATTESLFSFLDVLGISHQTTTHPAVFTAAEGGAWRDTVPGLHCKNLFLQDAKGLFWLVVMPADKHADLTGLAKRLGAPKFSFAKPEALREILGLTPGSVTPFALLNDGRKSVRVVLDATMMKSAEVNYHPLHNEASTTLRSADVVKFIRALGYDPLIIDCGREEVALRG